MNETMGNPQATQAEIGWLAGIIDGEGHIGISLQGTKRGEAVKMDLQIVNTDYGLIEKVLVVIGKLGVNPHIRERTHHRATWSTNWVVTVGKMAQIKRILDATKDHLTGMKREKADVMLALIESRLMKTRADRYSDYERSLTQYFRDRFVGVCGASTTAREARKLITPVKIQSVLA